MTNRKGGNTRIFSIAPVLHSILDNLSPIVLLPVLTHLDKDTALPFSLGLRSDLKQRNKIIIKTFFAFCILYFILGRR